MYKVISVNRPLWFGALNYLREYGIEEVIHGESYPRWATITFRELPPAAELAKIELYIDEPIEFDPAEIIQKLIDKHKYTFEDALKSYKKNLEYDRNGTNLYYLLEKFIPDFGQYYYERRQGAVQKMIDYLKGANSGRSSSD